MKVCPKCKHELPFNDFGTNKRDGIQSWCKMCRRKNRDPVKTKVNTDRYRHTSRGILVSRYADIKRRCENPKHKYYDDYGGRGIKCCFKSSAEFAEYVLNNLGSDPTGLDVDRIDNNDHYESGNIRLVPHQVNQQNRRNCL